MRLRPVVISLLAGLTGMAVMPWTAAAATTFNVTATGMSAYIVDGVNDATLTLTRGQTYTFNVDTFGHPLWITTVRGAGDAELDAFSQGVTNNGVGSSPGTLTFVVPASAPATLFYQCSFHDPMGGTLNIVAPAAATVPSVGRVLLAVLTGLLLIVALAAIRKRRARA